MLEARPAKARIRAAFNAAATRYDGAALVQREASTLLLGLLDANPPKLAVHYLLEGGCGTGHALPALAARFPAAQLVALDFAPAMLDELPPAHAHALCADLEALPLASASIDACWSSLALQWCRPAPALAECARVLRPGGSAWFATLGPATLHELREAFAGIDDAAHVIDFHSAEQWLDAARSAGLNCRAATGARLQATAGELRELLRAIKAIGAHSVGSARRRAPLGRAAWRRLEAHYERHRRADGVLPASYEVILLALDKPE
jgi:malonyl-CoA O-methyltransferase